MKTYLKSLVSFVILLLGFFCFESTEAQNPKQKTDLEQQNIKGRVKSIREIPYTVFQKYGKIEKNDVSPWSVDNVLTVYNEKGNLIEKMTFDRAGSIVEQHFYAGTGIESQQESIFPNTSKLDSKYTYRYDSKGNKIEGKKYLPDGTLELRAIWQYKYDSKGNWIERLESLQEGAEIRPCEIIGRNIEYY